VLRSTQPPTLGSIEIDSVAYELLSDGLLWLIGAAMSLLAALWV